MPTSLGALLLVAAAAVSTPVISISASDAPLPTNAVIAASLEEVVGLACAADADCGYLPSLACVDGACDYCRLGRADCGDHPGDVSKRCEVLTLPGDENGAVEPLLAPNAHGEIVPVGYCVEKDLFSPFDWTDAAGTLVAFVSTALGSGCGIGGGGLLVPLYVSVMGLSPKHAIPLSKATIFGNAVAIYAFNFRRTRPGDPRLPVIDYAVAAVMEPMTLVGSVLGVMLNQTLPSWLILAMLVLLLAATTYKTAMKGVRLRQRESRERSERLKSVLARTSSALGRRASRWSIYPRLDAAAAARKWLAITRRNKAARATLSRDQADFESLPPLRPRGSSQWEEKAPLLPTARGEDGPGGFGTFRGASALVHADSDLRGAADGGEDVWAPTRLALREQASSRFPVEFVWPLTASWTLVFAQALLRGGHGAPSIAGMACGSDVYWVLTTLPLALLVALTARVGRGLRLRNRLKVLSGFGFAQGDIHWVRRRVVLVPAACVAAGAAAGLLGIGGGMVKGPIMLELGIPPAVQSATTSYMILFTASSTTLQFAVNGQFPGARQLDYALWFAAVGFLGGLTGQALVALLIRRSRRESVIVFIMAATIGLSALAMGLVGLQSTLADLQRGVHLGFHRLCNGA